MAEGIIRDAYLKAENAAALSESYTNAQPCKYLVMENFFTEEIANDLFENFPSIQDLNVKRKSLNEDKSEDYHFERWHPSFAKIREAVSSTEWYEQLTRITGIEGLHTTTDALGSGVHQGKNGSYVDIHIDVNMNPKLGLWRRINLLVYLNRDWKPEYGGDLELWNKEMTECVVKVPPTFNTAVIFYTDDNSPHGYRKINIPEGESRKSFYTYFYTKPQEGVSYRDSKFISRPDDGAGKKLATGVKETLKINGKKLLKFIGLKDLDFQDKN
jgi:Rps23 Pro-64 3,4-dihydroxylase Tpa1-like proline 4-hydroxylase